MDSGHKDSWRYYRQRPKYHVGEQYLRSWRYPPSQVSGLTVSQSRPAWYRLGGSIPPRRVQCRERKSHGRHGPKQPWWSTCVSHHIRRKLTQRENLLLGIEGWLRWLRSRRRRPRHISLARALRQTVRNYLWTQSVSILIVFDATSN